MWIPGPTPNDDRIHESTGKKNYPLNRARPSLSPVMPHSSFLNAGVLPSFLTGARAIQGGGFSFFTLTSL